MRHDFAVTQKDYSCGDLLALLIERKATDLILSVGIPPRIRIDKQLISLDLPNLTPRKSKELAYHIMNESQHKKLELEWEVDFSFSVQGLSRFRANVYMQRGTVAAAIRRIPFEIPTFDELSLPSVLKEMCDRPNGLILLAGPSGAGKSTTLAAMINHINITRQAHILTIEEPIEFLHSHKNCTIDQREVGADTKSFKSALKSALRQNPDVVMLGEMRDEESVQSALSISETGHLCFATLHTNSCSQTLSRIIDVFPGDKQGHVRTLLSMTLNAVVTQTLLPKIDGGLRLACEVMVANDAIRSLIRENKLHHIDNQIQVGSRSGMQSLNQSLTYLVKNNVVAKADALFASLDKDELLKNLNG